MQTLNARGAEKHLASLSRAQLGFPPREELWDGFSVEPSSVMGTLQAIMLAEGPWPTNLQPPQDSFVRLLFRDYSHGRYETSSQTTFQHLVRLESARTTSGLSSRHGQPRAWCVRTDGEIAVSEASSVNAAWAKVWIVQVRVPSDTPKRSMDVHGRDATTLRATAVMTLVWVVRGGAAVCCFCCFVLSLAGVVVAIRAAVVVPVCVWGTVAVRVVVVSGVVWGRVRNGQTVVVCDAGRGTQTLWHDAQRNLAREWLLHKRFCGGGPAPEVRDLVAGICLSAFGDAEQVAQLLEQDWVESWNGWAEMEADTRDVVAMAVAERFMRIAGANVPARMLSNRQRLQELEEEGLVLRVASPHGVNNCLIDAVLLGLAATGVAPEALSMKERQALCERCRKYLASQYSTPLGTYLDGHRDAPRILEFLLCQVWKADVSIRVRFYDCLDRGQLGEAGELLSSVDFTAGDRLIYERHMLHVYNHTDCAGSGYHFDALVRDGRSAANKGTAGVMTARKTSTRVGNGGEGAAEAAESPTVRGSSQKKSDREGTCIGEEALPVHEVQGLLQDFFAARGTSFYELLYKLAEL